MRPAQHKADGFGIKNAQVAESLPRLAPRSAGSTGPRTRTESHNVGDAEQLEDVKDKLSRALEHETQLTKHETQLTKEVYVLTKLIHEQVYAN